MTDSTDPRPERPLDDRRAFLRRVAKGTIYAAPIIRTLAAPDRLYAGNVSQIFMMSSVESAPAQPAQQSPFGTSPGQTAPPWSGPPPGSGPGSTGGGEE